MLDLREFRGPTKRLPDYLPWAGLVSRGVVLQKDAILQKTIAFRGHDLASSSEVEVVGQAALLNNALRRLGSGWAIFVEAARFEHSEYPHAQWPEPVSALVDFERREAFSRSEAHFESSYYVTLAWKMPNRVSKRFIDLFFGDTEESRGLAMENKRELEYFERVCGDIVNMLRDVFVEVAELDDGETLTYLHSTISTQRHPVSAAGTPFYLDALLPDEALTTGNVPMLGEYFLPTCTITGFPGATLPGILDGLNHLQVEYRWATRYICLDKEEAKKELGAYRRQWWSGRKGLWTLLKEEALKEESALVDTGAANKAGDADQALQTLDDGSVSFGHLTSTVTVWDKDLRRAKAKMAAVKRVVQSAGFTVRDETLNSFEAWLGSLPGHVYANVRRPLVHSLNLVHLMPVSAVWAGDAENAHLRKVCGVGTAHVTCSTVGDAAFRLNLAVDDLGHTSVIGPPGSGKSTLLSVLALQWMKYPGAQVVFFDKDRSSRGATLAVGGSYYEPGDEAAALAFQPLSGIDDPNEFAWAVEWICMLLTLQGVRESPELHAAVDEALRGLASDSEVSQRTLTVFAAVLSSVHRDFGSALRPYTMVGVHGRIFDADCDGLARSDAAWTTIEMRRLMERGEAAVVPALAYLFHRLEERFDGRPTLLVLDEAWLFMGHEYFRARLRTWLKTLRKRNVYVVFATQELADYVRRSELAATVQSAMATTIYLADPSALEPGVTALYEQFGLSEREIQIIGRAQKKRDYYYRSAKGRRLFSLDLGFAVLALVGSTPADQAALDECVADGLTGRDLAEALLRRRGVRWAADLLVDGSPEKEAANA
jgi:type IV secretion/conjugal transfer VirB4 family ATPase